MDLLLISTYNLGGRNLFYYERLFPFFGRGDINKSGKVRGVLFFESVWWFYEFSIDIQMERDDFVLFG